ncbi:hypothetical protein [Actinoplanes sp. M2I2]|uniref:LppU/SCO3897 family protein n=1 Tax=Actinoplanes sp. M2I2 TaxID=1734444 RepID=UPI0020206079|nr:hypothetical protein [Actinoplanes sp. M2I2]
MTSEGHYAGSQPAEATSGGPTPDGFPPDSDGQRVSGRASAPAPADGFPSSYGPPPQATPNGGSPFVVPAVPTFGQGPDGPRPATGTSYGSARVPSPDEARVPAPEDGGALPQRHPGQAPASTGSPAGENGALPQRGAASPYGSVSPEGSSGSPFGPSVFGAPPAETPAEQPQSVWGPPPARPSLEQSFIQRPGAPLPQRNANSIPGDGVVGFDGFAAASRGSSDDNTTGPSAASDNFAPSGASSDGFDRRSEPAQREPAQHEQADAADRAPGVSAFGAQRVRVPGATLTDLPDTSPPGRPGDSGGFPLRGGGGSGSAFPIRRAGDSDGFPLRGTPAGEGEPLPSRAAAAPPDELPVRTQQPSFGPPAGYPGQPAGSAQVPPANGFSAFSPPPEAAPHPYGGSEPFADPFGRTSPASDAPADQPSEPARDADADRGGFPDPFGRGSASAGPVSGSARPSGDGSGAYGSARPTPPFGQSDDSGAFGSARPAPPFGQSDDSGAFGSARPAPPADQPGAFGSARPPAGHDAPAFGSARAAASGRPDDDSGTATPRSGAPTYGTARPATPYGQPEGDSGTATPGSGLPAVGSARPGTFGPAGSGYGPDSEAQAYGSESPFGRPEQESGATTPGSGGPTFGTARPSDPYGRPDDDDGEAAFGQADSDSGGGPTYGIARTAAPYGQPGDSAPAAPGSGGPAFGSARPAGSFDRPESDSGAFGAASPFGDDQGDSRAAAPTYGSARPVSPYDGDRQDDDARSPFGPRPGADAEQPSSPFGVRREPGAAFGASSFAQGGDDRFAASGEGSSAQNGDDQSGDDVFGRRPEQDDPFGRRPEQDDPFGRQPEQGDNPFGQRPEQGAGPFGQRPEQSHPFGPRPTQGDNPFGPRPAQGENVFGQRSDQGENVFGQRSDQGENVFGQRSDQGGDPFGRQSDQSDNVFGRPEQDDNVFGRQSERDDNVFGQRPEQSGDDAFGRPDEQDEDRPSGYPQRVPGAALGALGSAEPRGSVPAPRDPAENPPAVGSARPVAASASVPTPGRATPPVEASEIPPSAAAPQARVYGRPAPADDADDDQAEPSHDADQGSAFAAGSPFGRRPGDDRAAPAPGGFGSPAYPGSSNDPNGPGSEPGVAPQSPARASARASASARVTPAGGPGQPPTGMPSAPALPGAAPEPAPPGSPYADRPGTPGARPGGEPYSEPTTDIAGRDHQPYVPAPALPPMPAGLNGFDPATQPRSNGFGPPAQDGFGPQPRDGFGPPAQDGFGPQPRDGFGPQSPNGFDPDSFPGSTSRATVTPPTPEETTSWPGVEADQGRFDSFKPEAKPTPAKAETPHVRVLPILISVVIGALLLLGIVFGIVYLVAGGGNDESLSVIQGECVKREGEAAVKSECSDATAFQVVSIVADKAECADPQQPYVVNKTSDGKNQVLCLKPNA